MSTYNWLERLAPSKKTAVKILHELNGIVKSSRMTLLLGPPGAGKTTFLLALANQLNKNLRVKGNVTYCGLEFSEFIPQRTCAYISQHDLHFGEMTVRETLEFSARCLGVGDRHELLAQILRREKEEGILPDPVIDAFMKATAIQGQETNLVTDYFLKMLGIDICADTVIGDQMRRGISGGQKKRVTIGEMLVGPAKVLLMDEISTGLDASTTYQICKFLRQMVHLMDLTCIISLLQPAPETYELFDDVILMSEGHIVYQGPRQNVLEFFRSMGFRCPERKGVADFLLEVTSRKDQAQYWIRENQAYRFVSVTEISEAFKSFHIGQQVTSDMKVPYERCKTHQSALAQQTYGLSNWELFRVCFSRELLLMKRNSFIYVFKAIQITIISLITMTVYLRTTMHHHTITDGEKYLGALFFSMVNATFNNMAEMALTVFKIPVLFKQRDFLFYPAWAYALPVWVLGIPLSFVESGIWVVLTYHSIGFAPAASRFFRQFLAFFGIHQMALPLFRLVAALGRTLVVSNMVMFFTLLSAFAVGGYIIAREDIPSWLSWAYYVSPIMYGQTAVAINEFLDERWSTPNQDPLIDQPTIGKCILASRGFFVEEYLYWICIGALLGFSLLFNVLFILALTYLNPYADLKSLVPDENYENLKPSTTQILESSSGTERGMILPFQPLTLAFNNVNYYVDVPPELKAKGFEDDRLQLLRGVSGSFRPGILTALVGVSGAGKTTLMDVLAGRKTTGYIEGSIKISGYPKKHETFARISGYCEQTDVHSPCVTVYESLLFSAWLRLPSDVNASTRKMITEEVMELIELKSLSNALIGLPGVDGLTTEQRKRLTMAVELVANPSIIFMDEPTSGLDARAAAIVMRTIRNTVNTGRTVVCTIHQPSIDIFEAFDELLLMKRGGQVIYAGPRGYHSCTLIKYFEAVCGVPKIKEGYNPATWMLDITDPHFEAQLNVDFAEIYVNSNVCRENQELITKLSCPSSNSRDLYFPTKYSRSFISQCKACFWKQYLSYWRNAPYNVVRFLTTIVLGVLFGLIFWKQGGKVAKMQDIMNLTGFLYMATLFPGSGNAATIQPVIAIERTVLNRERAAGMYSALAYAVAQVEVEAIYIVIQSSIYTILLYSMIGFEWAILKFLYFYYFVFMCFLYFTIYGMMLVALTPGEEIGAVVMVFFVSFWNLFAGFLIARPEIPIWWRWYYWASPISWTLYGLLTSQFGDNNSPLTVPGGGGTTVKDFLKDYFGFDQKFLPIVVIAHLGWVILFLFVFAYAIKYLNFQRR